MTFKGLINDKFLKSPVVAGVDCLLGDAMEMTLVILKKERSSVKPELIKTGIKTVEELKTLLPKQIPIYLNLQGKGLMHRKVGVRAEDDSASLLHKVLPNAGANDFYVQNVPSGERDAIVSVVRKNVTNELLAAFKKENLEVIHGSLGPFCLKSLIPLLSESNYFELKVPGWNLVFNNGELESFSPNADALDDNYTVSGMEIPTKALCAFAVALDHFIGLAGTPHADIMLIEEARDDFRQKKIFQMGGWALLVATLAILMGNYFLFSHYWAKQQSLQQEVSLNASALDDFEKLKASFAERQAFAEKTGLSEGSRSSFYADRIANGIPETIQLSRMDIFPVMRKLGEEENLSYTQKLIRIEGVSRIGTELDAWIKNLKKKEFVSDVQLIHYSQDNSKTPGSFTLEVKLN